MKPLRPPFPAPPRARGRRRRAAALVAALLLAALPASPDPAAPPGLHACRLRGVSTPAWCGRLLRPLAADAPGGPTIELHYAVLPALARQRKPDPVFFFAGGPGQSAIDLAGPVAQLLARLSNRRDLVFIDQRGTGRSAPLSCDDNDAPTRPLHAMLDEALALRELARCRERLQALPHGDLRRYTTVDAVQDAEAVRRALGAAQVNLVGVSYGTRVALDYLRQAPQAVRRVVLDGVAPPDMALPASFARDAQAVFDALLAWCEADRDCRARHPRLRAHWAALLAALPRELELVQPVSGQVQRIVLTPQALAGLVRAPLYTPLLASALPQAIDAAAAGRWAPLLGLASALQGSAQGRIAQGEHFAVVCSEDMPRVDAQAVPPPTDFAGLAEPYRRACADWPRATLPAAFYRIGPAPVPVLLLAGALDPVTPPRHAARVAAQLGARARQLVVPAAGHGQLALPCVRELVHRFVDAEEEAEALALETGCADQHPRPPVFVPPGAGEAAR